MRQACGLMRCRFTGCLSASISNSPRSWWSRPCRRVFALWEGGSWSRGCRSVSAVPGGRWSCSPPSGGRLQSIAWKKENREEWHAWVKMSKADRWRVVKSLRFFCCTLTPLWTRGLQRGCSTQTAWRSRGGGTPRTHPHASRHCRAGGRARWGPRGNRARVWGWPRTWTNRSTASLWLEGLPHERWRFAKRKVKHGRVKWQVWSTLLYKYPWFCVDSFLSWHIWMGRTCGVPRRSINGTRCSAVYLASKRFILASRRSPSALWKRHVSKFKSGDILYFYIVKKSPLKKKKSPKPKVYSALVTEAWQRLFLCYRAALL